MSKLDERLDLQRWATEWQAGGVQDADTAEQIRHYVNRRSGLVWSFVLGDFVVAGIALPILAYLGVAANNDLERLVMMALASITIGAVGFGWWNWRSVLRASANSVSEYVAISSERLRRMGLALRIGWLVLGAQVAVYVIWIPNHVHDDGTLPSPAQLRFAWVWLLGFATAAAMGMLWFGRWLKRDAARLEALQRELE